MFRLEVIDFLDQSGSAVVARVPAGGTAAIKLGAQLIVQQNQEAIFFRDGRAMDVFGPGRHTLSTANVPILTSILTIPWEKSPFQACVYFVGKQRFIDQGWGTRQPITMKDPDFGMVRLRGFGKFSFRVVDSSLLINEIVGTQGMVSASQISDYLRDVVVSGLSDLLATSNLGLLQMTAKFDELGMAARLKIGEQFKKFGLELTDLIINNISPPEEVQKAIDARSSMSAIGDLRSYTLYQAANGLAGVGGGADGGGSPAASMAAMGVGAGMGMMLPPIIQQALQQAPAQAMGAAASPTPFSPAGQTAPAGQTGGSQAAQGAVDSVGQIQQTLRSVGKQLGWSLSESDSQWLIKISLGPLRKQDVHIDFSGIDEAGHRIVSIWSTCGVIDGSSAMTLLRYNAQIVHGAFAVNSVDGADVLVIRGNLLADTADPLELTRTVTAVAWQANQAEQQLIGHSQA
jgi:membrane protease subunit (stomatin/prohibitin family)